MIIMIVDESYDHPAVRVPSDTLSLHLPPSIYPPGITCCCCAVFQLIDLILFFGYRVVAVVWRPGLTRYFSGPTNVGSIPAAVVFLLFRAFGIRDFWWTSGGNIILHLVDVVYGRVPNGIIPGWDHVRELVIV